MRDEDFIRQLLAIGDQLPAQWEDAPLVRAMLHELATADPQTSNALIRDLLELLSSYDLSLLIAGMPAADTRNPQWIELDAIVTEHPTDQIAWIVDVMANPDRPDGRLIKAEWGLTGEVVPIKSARHPMRDVEPRAVDTPTISLNFRDHRPRLIEERIRDVEPADQPGRPTPPEAAAVGTIQRIPHIDVGEYADAAVPVGSSFSVSVYVDTEALDPGEQGAPIVLPERRELKLAVILTTSTHFTVDGDGRGEIVVRPGEPRSSAATFTLTCQSANEPQAGIAVAFYLDWRPVGSVSRQLTVAGGPVAAAHLLQPAAAVTGAGALAIHDDNPSAPDLSVTIRRAPDGDERHYTVTVSSPHLARLTKGITVAWNLPMATRDMVQEMMSTILTTDPGGPKAALIGSGRRLFDATPPEFQKAFWDLIDYSAANNVPFETIYVVTDEPHIPWELMVPKRDGKLRPALGVEFSVGRWVHPNLVSPEQTVPITDSWVIAPEYLAPDTLDFSAEEAQFVIDAFNGERLTPALILSIDEKLGARGASLLHFICHGTSEPTVQILELDPDERLTDIQIEGLEGVARAFAEHHPLVFINACQVGQINPALVGSTGFAAVFTSMGARGVIAPIWSVADSVAAQVAREFYTRIRADPTLPYAKAMQEIRRLAYEGQDPKDSYAAYCFYGDPKSAQARPA